MPDNDMAIAFGRLKARGQARGPVWTGGGVENGMTISGQFSAQAVRARRDRIGLPSPLYWSQ